MTRTTPPQKPPQIPLNSSVSLPIDAVIQFVQTGNTAAVVGMGAVNELRSILKAIAVLSREHQIVCELAKIGVNLADSQHNLLDVIHDEVEQNALALQGAKNV